MMMKKQNCGHVNKIVYIVRFHSFVVQHLLQCIQRKPSTHSHLRGYRAPPLHGSRIEATTTQNYNTNIHSLRHFTEDFTVKW